MIMRTHAYTYIHVVTSLAFMYDHASEAWLKRGVSVANKHVIRMPHTKGSVDSDVCSPSFVYIESYIPASMH